ncbi:MAG: beta-N-acetylhexosaminidase [Deltaproteobacteria bacterium]|nr:beta-N-acetylhexosaminidase [Deltaproteobacteria bacterium]
MTQSVGIGELVGKLVVGGFYGKSVPPEFATLVRRKRVGGAILFSRNFESVANAAELVAELRSLDPRLWIAIDQEGGRVQRLKEPFPQLPPMRTVGRGGVAGARKAAEILAKGMRAMGIQQDYVPDVDVDTNPQNPVIGDRSFDRDPHRVAELGAAFIEELQRHGVAACAKHFPGHGDTHQDSHHELPTLPHDFARLEAVELVPFASAVKAGVATVMTAHVLFPALDPAHPATISDTLIGPVLRQRFGYEGVVVSDDLEMRAIADNYGMGDAAVRAIRAGCDQLLVCHEVERQEAVHSALLSAVEMGLIARARVVEAYRRVETLIDRFPVDRPEPSKLAALSSLRDELLRMIDPVA